MLAWSFAARSVDEVTRLVRALSKHRYVQEVDLRLHWSVDRALAHIPSFARHAEAFEAFRKRDPELDPASRDPRLWREASLDDVVTALTTFWTPGPESDGARERLLLTLLAEGLPPADHEPFESDPDEPPHPELVLLDWVVYAVEDLDPERHAGALRALEDSGDEIEPSEPIYQEGPVISSVELTHGAVDGVLTADFSVWSDGPYHYSDYVFRGAAKSAKLDSDPVGLYDDE